MPFGITSDIYTPPVSGLRQEHDSHWWEKASSTWGSLVLVGYLPYSRRCFRFFLNILEEGFVALIFIWFAFLGPGSSRCISRYQIFVNFVVSVAFRYLHISQPALTNIQSFVCCRLAESHMAVIEIFDRRWASINPWFLSFLRGYIQFVSALGWHDAFSPAFVNWNGLCWSQRGGVYNVYAGFNYRHDPKFVSGIQLGFQDGLRSRAGLLPYIFSR